MGIKGITVTLHKRTETGRDAFNAPTYTEKDITVEDVLVSPVSEQEVLDTLNLTGRKAVYQLAIPKGDTNKWEDNCVSFFGQRWRVISYPIQGIDENIPLRWNKKVKVERIE